MIHNWTHHSLVMDFSKIENARCSDIDLFYLHNGFLILGEIKHESGIYSQFQRELHKELVDNYSKDAILLYIVHDRLVQEGAKKVDVSRAIVKEYYWRGKWHEPKTRTTVNEAFQTLMKRRHEYGRTAWDVWDTNV